MKLQKVLSVILALSAVVTCFAGCSSDEKETRKKNPFDTKAVSSVIDDKFIAENDNFKLEINDTTMGVSLTDKKTGQVYGTNPVNDGDTEYNEILGTYKPRNPQVESVLFIKYLDTEKNVTSDMISYTAAIKNGRTVFEKFENGIKINYYFDDAEIMVPVTYTLTETGVELSVNPDEIQENKNMLITVSLAPMFCSVKNKKDGYLLYPSGSGSLVYAKEISSPGETYSDEVYGADASKEVWDKTSTNKAIRLPVFGAKFDNQAVFGIIEQGAESSLLDMKVGSKMIGYSAVYVTYQVRGFTPHIKELYNNRYVKNDVFSTNMISTPLKVSYNLLKDEEANYSTMAKIYRDYLDKTVGKAENVTPSTLDVTMVGGAMIDESFLGIPYKTILETTTLSDVQKIVNDLNKKGVKITNLNLAGFTVNGIDSNMLGGGFEIDSALGEAEQLATIKKNCSKNKINLFVDLDIVGFNEDGNGFDTYFDAATRANKKVAKIYSFDIAIWGRNTEDSYSLLARDRIADAAKEAIAAVKDWKNGGIALSTLTSLTYSDYSDKENSQYYAKANMGNQVSSIIKDAKKNNLLVLSSDANAYAAAASNVVLNVPTNSTGAYIFDEDVPFYAMVMRGRTAISGDSLNLATSSDLQLLRSVESGAGLSYTLINNYSTRLIDVNSTVFYNSLYSDLSKQIVANYNKVSSLYEKIGNSVIVAHTILDSEKGLRETVYENGVKVFVNYGSEDVETELGVVKAKSFLVGEAKA